MIIRDVHYKITGIHYSVHYKNRSFKRVRIDCYSYKCMKCIFIIHKTSNRYNREYYSKCYTFYNERLQ